MKVYLSWLYTHNDILCICMYVHTYVCLFVCLFACLSACMYIRTYICKYRHTCMPAYI